jgi:hypothetical protein
MRNNYLLYLLFQGRGGRGGSSPGVSPRPPIVDLTEETVAAPGLRGVPAPRLCEVCDKRFPTQETHRQPSGPTRGTPRNLPFE